MQKNTFPPVCSWENFPFFLQFYAIFKKFLRTLKSRATITTQNNTQSPALKSLLEEGSRTTELCAEHSHSHGDNRERLLLFRDCWTRVISCFFLSHSRIFRSVFHSGACAPSSVGGRVQLSKNAFLPLVESFKRRFFGVGNRWRVWMCRESERELELAQLSTGKHNKVWGKNETKLLSRVRKNETKLLTFIQRETNSFRRSFVKRATASSRYR